VLPPGVFSVGVISLTHDGQAYYKTSLTELLANGESSYVLTWGKRTPLWTFAELEPALFRANALHNRLFSEPPTVYRETCVVSHHFDRSYLKSNKISKSQGYGKLNMHIIFGRPLGPGLCHRKSVRLSVCNVGVLWPNGLSDRDDFWHTPCPGQQWPCIRRRSESPHWGGFEGGFTKRTTSRSGRPPQH